MIIDSHCHLYDEKLKVELPRILEEISKKDIFCVCCGADVETSKQCVQIAKENSNIFATVGYHPEYVANFKDEDISKIEKLSKEKKVLAVGEIGLDYYYEKESKTRQKEMLVSQIMLADKLGLPCVFHVREAMGDFLDIIRNHRDFFKHSAVVHSFSGSEEVAKILVDFGFFLGINGIVTFKNARGLLDVVRSVSMDRILIETDSPYLTPEPHRGKNNEPKFVEFVAKKVAEIKGLTVEEVIRISAENTKRLFNF
ncbi:MAG: TatD family deoxyribonuclease [Clostridia bacterium]|nr:TatD family deoxyribonuclease [Clostridia bacterium]